MARSVKSAPGAGPAMKESTRPQRVFLIGNARKPKVPETYDRLRTWLEHKGLLAGCDLDCRPELIEQAQPDLIIALGGDGTILAVGQALQHRQVPIIGVNMGKLGYLADFSADELQRDWDQLVGHPELVSRRMMLDAKLTSLNENGYDGIALNDCVIRVAEPFRTVALDVEIDGRFVTTIICDGLIAATPTGSTAHNMSCGGPIVEPDVNAIILTPIAPHSLTHRPIVVGPNARVRIVVGATSDGAALVLDGRFVRPLNPGAQLALSRSTETFQLVRNPRRGSWESLVLKLKWGQGLT